METRQIKFRAWDITNNRIVELPHRFELSYTEYHKNLAPYIFYESWRDEEDGIQRPCFIMQFINSNDADGKEIYEGDILQAPSGNVFEVKWYNEELRWAMYRLDTWYNMNCGILRVIGNIYENHELLNTGA